MPWRMQGTRRPIVSVSPQWFWQGRIDRLRTWIRDRIRSQVPEADGRVSLSGLAVGDQKFD